MTSDDEKTHWLTEHLFYEWTMLRHTIANVANAKISSDLDQLEYNTNYVAFMTHARNMYLFLTNGVKKGDFAACDFVPNFKSMKTDQTKSINQRLNPQVFHLDEERPTMGPDKINNVECHDFFSWVDGEFRRFESQLAESSRSAWLAKTGGADNTIVLSPEARTTPTACGYFTSTTSGTPSTR